MAEFKFTTDSTFKPDLATMRRIADQLTPQGFILNAADLLPEGYSFSVLVSRDRLHVQLFYGTEEIEFPLTGKRLPQVIMDAIETARGIEAVKMQLAKGEL
jgi:hypothetical protein